MKSGISSYHYWNVPELTRRRNAVITERSGIALEPCRQQHAPSAECFSHLECSQQPQNKDDQHDRSDNADRCVSGAHRYLLQEHWPCITGEFGTRATHQIRTARRFLAMRYAWTLPRASIGPTARRLNGQPPESSSSPGGGFQWRSGARTCGFTRISCNRIELQVRSGSQVLLIIIGHLRFGAERIAGISGGSDASLPYTDGVNVRLSPDPHSGKDQRERWEPTSGFEPETSFLPRMCSAD
jgi:hypothetical protein